MLTIHAVYAGEDVEQNFRRRLRRVNHRDACLSDNARAPASIRVRRYRAAVE